jgi:hypothetical protein
VYAQADIFDLALSVDPIPTATQVLAQRRSPSCRMRGYQGADQFYVCIAYLAPLQNHSLCHGAKFKANGSTEFSSK